MIIVLVHVVIATLSIISSTILAITPSKLKLYLSSALISLTLISGTLLVISTHVNILKTCISGLVYLAVVMVLVALGSRSLATSKVKKP